MYEAKESWYLDLATWGDKKVFSVSHLFPEIICGI